MRVSSSARTARSGCRGRPRPCCASRTASTTTTTAASSSSGRTAGSTSGPATAARRRSDNHSQNLSSRLGKLLRLNVDKRGRALADRRATGCGTRGASRGTAPPATSTSATSARTRGRRSTCARRRSSAAEQLRLAGLGGPGRYQDGQQVNPRGSSSSRSSTTPTARAARSRAATSTAGKAVPSARGRYFYGDYCNGTIWSLARREGEAARGAARAVQRPERSRRSARTPRASSTRPRSTARSTS